MAERSDKHEHDELSVENVENQVLLLLLVLASLGHGGLLCRFPVRGQATRFGVALAAGAD